MRNVLIALLSVVGLLGAVADMRDMPRLGAFASAVGASPSPSALPTSRYARPITHDVFLDWDDARGLRHALRLTPATRDRIAGPGIRRTMYTRVLTQAPGDITAVDRSVRAYGLCRPGALLSELGVRSPSYLRIRRMPRPSAPPPRLPELDEPCSQS